MISYSVAIDEKFLEQYQERIRAQSVTRFGRYGLKFFCLLGLAALLAIVLYAKVWVIAPVPILFAALLLAGPKFDYWIAKRRLRKSPFYGQTARATLDGDGYTEVNALSNHTLSWAAFTRVIRMQDGFLLGLGPRQWHWLPDSALVNGTVAEVALFLQEKVPSNAG
jgi:hypothetical protein